MPFDLIAFQLDAFQSGAFQQEVLAEAAFQECAFQFDAFQADFCQDVIEPPQQVPSTGGGWSKRRTTKRKAHETYLAPPRTKIARDYILEALAERRAQEMEKQVAVSLPSALLPKVLREIIERAITAPLPGVTQHSVEEKLPRGREKWEKRQRLDLQAARGGFLDRTAAQKALIAHETALREELRKVQAEELDVVFVSAMMALATIDD